MKEPTIQSNFTRYLYSKFSNLSSLAHYNSLFWHRSHRTGINGILFTKISWFRDKQSVISCFAFFHKPPMELLQKNYSSLVLGFFNPLMPRNESCFRCKWILSWEHGSHYGEILIFTVIKWNFTKYLPNPNGCSVKFEFIRRRGEMFAKTRYVRFFYQSWTLVTRKSSYNHESSGNSATPYLLTSLSFISFSFFISSVLLLLQ